MAFPPRFLGADCQPRRQQSGLIDSEYKYQTLVSASASTGCVCVSLCANDGWDAAVALGFYAAAQHKDAAPSGRELTWRIFSGWS
jgi:hypothetical protein